MKFNQFVKVLELIPAARKHMIKVKTQLTVSPNTDVLINNIPQAQNHQSVFIQVKSYFWASRLIANCHCLPRSIALYQQLKGQGYDVEHKMGVNTEGKDMSAHAWVEYQGRPLNENKNLKNKFKVLNKHL